MSRSLEIALDGFWIAVILGGGGWLFFRSLKNHENPPKAIFKIILTVLVVGGTAFLVRSLGHKLTGDLAHDFAMGLFMAGTIVACGFFLSIAWTPQISAFIFSPLTSIFDGGNEPPERKPLYSIAITKRNRGKPLEAVMAVREQLAKFPNDFEGVLLLASLQAEDLNDLPGAEITLNNFCQAPDVPDRQVVAAWMQLADWHLQKAVDVDAARAALQKIVARFPDTEFALRAEQRLAHLGETEKILLAAHDRQAVAVPAGVGNIGLLDSTEFLKPREIEPGKLAAAYVKHLEAHPRDAEVREKLAVIYARDFQRLDLATMELMELINEPRHAPKRIAGWLNQLANFQIELGADVATVRGTLEQIVGRFPDLPLADITRRRLARIEAEFKGKKETPGVKLGVYEQNVGLKYGSPYRAPRSPR
jgi:hypothetical protein